MGVGDYRSLYNDVKGTNTDIFNRFNTYKPEHSYSDMTGTIDNIFNQQGAGIQRNAANSIQRGTRDAAARMASQGITGGSVMNNQMNKISDNINTGASDALAQLGIGKMNTTIPLMQQDNANQMAIANAATGVDSSNRMALLQRLGLQNGVLGGQQAAEQYENNKPGFLDDLFAGIKGLSSIAAIPTSFAAGGGVSGNILSSLLKG